ncbi:MAG TPA: putative lipid II flippase FtsW [Thermoanaerobaculia bacterium]|nr:putative lipid II flippase FtsW [Thermoanaerobaculia bacterium]
MARKLDFDKVLFAAVLLLLALGLLMVYSASVAVSAGDAGFGISRSPFVKQLVAACVGLVAMAAAMALDYRLLRRPAVLYAAVLGVLALLVAVLFAPMLNETRRWLFVGGISIQPSELAKLALVLFLAYQIDRKREDVNQPVALIPCVVLLGVLCVLIVLEPDFGTAMLLVAVATFMLFVGGLSWRYLGLAALGAIPIFFFLVLSVPYRRDRLFAFLRPEDDPLDKGFQVIQSLIAVGSGGISGVGLGQSVQKLHFLPLANSDFIFAILCEELGLIGGGLVLLLLGVVGWRGLRAGARAPDAFGRYLAWGITAMILIQALVNISITLNLVPTTGTPLPLVSYGGSSLVTVLLSCGLLLNVSQHA